jgi:hypothetical protein
MTVSIKKINYSKLKPARKNSLLAKLTRELLAHKRISLPDRGKEENKVIV